MFFKDNRVGTTQKSGLAHSLINIKLSQLIISPMNVRVVGASKQEDKELTASIRAKGILQNLVVVPVEGQQDKYEVIAGGRRFSVLSNLLNASEIDGDYMVPCAVRGTNEATDIGRGREQQTLVVEQTQFNLSDYWLPTNENYFSRIKRDDLMVIGVSLAGEDFANCNAKAKKGELASHIADLPERGEWLPEVMSV